MHRNSLIEQLRQLPARQRVITALDVSSGNAATELGARLGSDSALVKVGLELFSAAGPAVVRQLQALGCEIFLDLKYHDIPNTIAGAARLAAGMGVAMTTVHASAGRRGMTAAAEALASTEIPTNRRRPALLGVTVLTSLTAQELDEVAPSPLDLPDRIVRLARLAWDSGCDGIVCAPTDLGRVRAELGPEPLVVTPGIRPAPPAGESPATTPGGDDQRRVATPAFARREGADFLVIGRPITRAADPAAALAEIGSQLDS
ncbi:MAG: orotidine-5'-phosphate decarboxylase [bacterium]